MLPDCTPTPTPTRLSMQPSMQVMPSMPPSPRRPSKRPSIIGRKFSAHHFKDKNNMTYSLTISETTAFTVTHARHMAAKVATDLKRLQRFYGKPTDAQIAAYEIEVIELLKAGYLGT